MQTYKDQDTRQDPSLSTIPPAVRQPPDDQPLRAVYHTTCCIVGGGPAGMLLSLMLARQGIQVILLEAHADFDREFRGDTVHPSVLEILDELGMAEQVLQLRHTKIRQAALPGLIKNPLVDFSRLKTRYPYVAMLPQADFLEYIAGEAQRYPHFQLMMGANVHELIIEDGKICGVCFQGKDGAYAVRSSLTIAADGRFSRVRKLAGIEPIKTSPPMDVLWFKLPRQPSDPEGGMGRFAKGHLLIALDRTDTWQLGYVIWKGSFQQVRAAGLASLRQSIVELMPALADRVDKLQDWKQLSLLSVESSRVRRWYKPGLLLIGDAAHAMSPVGGVGINYAIQDAVVAANVLSAPLRAGRVSLCHLAAVQRRREIPTRVIQGIQTLIQERVIAHGLNPQQVMTVPPLVRFLLRIPFVRDIPARLIGFGVWPVHVRHRSQDGRLAG
ncbi:MAG: FAD-dependent oxidoreductase [Chloroflexales bacterium]|nr:FAD-dependent oxidoreductase [Chloroflexales bacterium]